MSPPTSRRRASRSLRRSSWARRRRRRSGKNGRSPERLRQALAPPGLAWELVDHPRYRIVAAIGAGGMGTVYRAEHRVMDRPVALKVIRADLLGNEALVERFRREVKAAARLASHPNIVVAYDAEQAGGTHMLVMEFVEGTDLARLVERGGPLPVGEACEYVRQAALGLAARLRGRHGPPRYQAAEPDAHDPRADQGPRLRSGPVRQ